MKFKRLTLEEKEYLKEECEGKNILWRIAFHSAARIGAEATAKVAITLLVMFIFGIFLAPAVIQTKIEQDTFNKVSKTKVTFVQAWVMDLRLTPDYN